MILRSAIALAFAAVTCLACRLSPEPRQGEECGVVMKLPSAVGRFIGDPGEVTKIERDTLPSDTEIVRMVYHTPGLRQQDRHLLTMSIVLSGSERRSIHRPEVCLSGQGWTVVEAKNLNISIDTEGEITARDLLIEKSITLDTGERRKLRAHYVYWFVGSKVTTPSHWTRIWLSARDSILRNVNHRWAYPAIMALVTDNLEPSEIGQKKRNSKETLDQIAALIREVVPRFQLDSFQLQTTGTSQP
jgi:hypothetical protein